MKGARHPWSQARPHPISGCTADQVLVEKECDGLKVLTVDANRVPFIARNTKLAWES